ncbi:TetR family transcriptional regulator [Streptomyces noursei]|nr:TetR family transcriptional regulator [Streptomyces noursei]
MRTRRTRALLRSALIELIEERGFDRLTVGEITQRAVVSRAAFYRNYRDKYYLVEQIFDEAIGELIGTMSEGGSDGDDGDERPVEERWVAFFEHIAHYHRLYSALLGKKGSPWFADRMRGTLADMIKEHVPTGPKAGALAGRSPATGLVPSLLAALFVRTITWWLENERPLSPGQIAVHSVRLALAVIAEANNDEG